MTLHPYSGRTAVLATMHRKDAAFAPPLGEACGLRLRVPDGLDTDAFGTFSGEVARAGTALEAAIAKARAAMAMSGMPLGLANEGSFGSHPDMPFAAAGFEIAVFLDDDSGLRIVEQTICLETNYAMATTRDGRDLASFLVQAKFPSHALIVRPNAAAPGVALTKGIAGEADLLPAIAFAARESGDGLALVQTDMRAHVNPTRMAALRKLAIKLSARLANLCPFCGTPGYGLVEAPAGLPCSDCGSPTSLTLHEVHGCVRCGAREIRPRGDGLVAATPGQCPRCNP